jgi:hypothetical protein
MVGLNLDCPVKPGNDKRWKSGNDKKRIAEGFSPSAIAVDRL